MKKPSLLSQIPDSGSDLKAQSLYPLLVIVSYLVGSVLFRASLAADFSIHSLMNNLMGGFFVLFSLFKMINIKGFADSFAMYDIVAKKCRAYALSYPFIELGLGLLYFSGRLPTFVNVATLVLMALGSIGVLKALANKRSIQCACLGTALNLPMTKVTLIENTSMGIMALIMLII